jgi:hypothetical protein
MDNRLKDIQHGTLTESRLNSDFLFWLKTKGPNYLLLAMLVLCGFMGFNWWENRMALARDGAWNEFLSAQTPQALIEVANKHTDTDAISQLATINAADAYMQSIQMNKRFDREAGAADAAVTPELRAEYLAEADRLYAKVVSEGSQSAGPRSLVTVTALFGRASVAETKNDPTQAALFLTQAQELAAKTYPQLAKVAQHRKETLPQLANVRPMPSRPVDPAAPASTSASTENLLMPTNMNASTEPQTPVTPAEGSAPVAPK